MKEAFAYLNDIARKKVERRIELNHKKTLKEIETDRILEEYGNFTQLLPDELKSMGRDKSYSKGPQVHNVEKGLAEINRKAYREG